MKKTIKALRRGIKAAMTACEPEKFQAGDKQVTCSHCGHDLFVPYGLTQFATEGLLHEVHGLRCRKCSHVEFFAERPAAVGGAAH